MPLGNRRQRITPRTERCDAASASGPDYLRHYLSESLFSLGQLCSKQGGDNRRTPNQYAFLLLLRELDRGWQEGHGGRPTGYSQDVPGRYEQQLKDQQEAYGEAMLEMRAQKK